MNGPQAIMLAAWIAALLGPPLAFSAWRRSRRDGRATVSLAVFAVVYGLGVWAFVVEPQLLIVRRVSVASAAWRGPPLRIGVISDTHVGAPYVDPVRVLGAVRRLNAEKPDLVVFLGDYAGGREPAAQRAAPDRSAILRGVAVLGNRSAAPLGKVAVLGDHDWWFDGLAIEAAFRRSGVTVLENGAARIARPEGAFWVVGVADSDSRRARPSAIKALSTVAAGEPVILLSHRSDIHAQAAAGIALTLAGHGRNSGLHEGARPLFATTGLGMAGVPARLGAPPEVAVVTLSAAP